MQTSETVTELYKALAEFKKNIKQPMKDKDNPFFKSKYVPLENVVEVIDKIASKHGLAYIQEAYTIDNGLTAVVTRMTHVSGEWVQTRPLALRADKDTAQGQGSVITYAKRYQLSALFGITSDEDDDGNSTTRTQAQTPPVDMNLKEALEVKMPFGKYKGKTMKDIGMEDTDYLKWLSGQEITDPRLDKAVELINQAGKKQPAPVVDEYALPEALPADEPKEPEQVDLDWMNA